MPDPSGGGKAVRMGIASIIVVFCSFVPMTKSMGAEEPSTPLARLDRGEFDLYPATFDESPGVPSPAVTADGVEIVLAVMKDGTFALIPVTVENGSPLHYSKRVKSALGKDAQLEVDKGDFPTLAATGLHAESELRGKEMITGFPVSLITYIGRPERFSHAGFMAEDEDILAVLIGDNRIVGRLGLTHPQMARPLFHTWNIILKEIELGRWERFWDHIRRFYYNGRKVDLSAHGTKGWQISIFQDEVQGSFDIAVHGDLSAGEKSFLEARYAHLSDGQMTELEEKLSSIHFSEMAPYYVMRYGFYEGHTSYRSDPVAIAFIFGLRSLEEIDEACQGDLYGTLTDHFTTGTIGD
jgi:hypothetical protein